MPNGRNILVTGAAGFVGKSLLTRIIKTNPFPFNRVIGIDVRPADGDLTHANFEFVQMDIRDENLTQFMNDRQITNVVHLASIVTPGKKSNRELEYDVDVLGTKNVLKACVECNVSQLIVTSSGAAYGYYADHPAWIGEDTPIRGNEEFAYSFHKRLIEEELKTFRERHPNLKQLVLRPGTILGEHAKNQITDLFHKPVILAIRGSDSPFVFIWDEDVIDVIYQGLREERAGIYNLAGDGSITLKEIAGIVGKPYLSIPPGLLKGALSALKKLKLTQYGPEQLSFLRYRPVLDNQNLKNGFGFKPRFTSREGFLEYAKFSGLIRD